jgi:hypothetical protein
MGAIVKARYLRLMELVSHGYSWDDAAVLMDAPVSLSCILETVVPAPGACHPRSDRCPS